MSPAARTELHDRTVDRLFDAIRAVIDADPDHTVLRRVRWAPHPDFPGNDYLFDILIVHGTPGLTTDTGTVRLTGTAEVATGIDVIDADYEPEYYDKPDALGFSATHEYVLFDPSNEIMRPNLSAARKRDDSFQPVRSVAAGVFFSSAGFRLDVRGPEFIVTACGRPWDEEELLQCHRAFDKLPSPRLAEKITRLEARVKQLRRRPDAGEGV